MNIKLTKNGENSNIEHILSSSSTSNSKGELQITSSFILHTSGNIGINKNLPNYKLDVSGNINFTGNIYKNGNVIANSNADYITSTQISTTTLAVDVFTGGNMSIANSITTGLLNISNSLDVKNTEIIQASTLLTDGLIGQYTGNSWNTTTYTWTDLSGLDNHVTIVTNGSSISVSNITSGSTIKFISGSSNVKLIFPAPILQTDYTFFHIAKYNGSSRDRIFDGLNRTGSGSGENWLSGFWFGRNGVAHQTDYGFITQSGSPRHGITNWVFSTHSNKSLYRSQGVNRTINSKPSLRHPFLTINAGGNGTSDWAVAEILVYNRNLTLNEINRVETYLFDKYNVLTNGYTGSDVLSYSSLYPRGSYTTGTTNTYNVFNVSNGNVGIGLNNQTYSLQLSNDDAGKPSTAYWTISSDERLKTNITTANLDICYDTIKNIPLKRYTWRDDVYSEEQVEDRSKLGWIAQDVEIVFPKAVNTISEFGISDCKNLNTDQIIASMYGCLQKLIKRTENFSERVNKLKE